MEYFAQAGSDALVKFVHLNRANPSSQFRYGLFWGDMFVS